MTTLKSKKQKVAEPSASNPEEKQTLQPASNLTQTQRQHAERTATAPMIEPETASPDPEDESGSPAEDTTEMRVNPHIEKEIAEYKAAYPRSVEYFTKLVKENPERAINFHFLEKQRQHAADTRRAMRQLPRVQELFKQMTPESQARVTERLQNATTYSYTKRFVWSVRRELNYLSAIKTTQLINAPHVPLQVERVPPAGARQETAPNQPAPGSLRAGNA